MAVLSEEENSFWGVGEHPTANVCAMRSVAVLIFLLVFLTAGGREVGAQSNDEEYRVKAAFLFHFAQLVDWPTNTQTGTNDSLFLCTFGTDPFQGALEATVEGKPIGNRVIRIRHLMQPQDMQACQVIFFGKDQSTRIPTLVADLEKAPILTVGESAGFLGAGGMICFLLEENKVRFQINLDAAESAKLKIGSRLLILAQNVVEEGRER
jgi:YfiR/HmsC-like